MARTGMGLLARLSRVGVLIIALAGSILTAEWFLQWRYSSLARSDRLSPGLTRPDTQLGWQLTPRWTGTHDHYDFSVSYRINGAGFRGADVRLHRPPARMVAVLGDSFTFGTGVEDDQIFSAILDRWSPDTERFYNFAVPGFSTDQEMLLAERDVLPLEPHTLLLVVYLANDLFDNQLPQALQVRRAKPVFTLEDTALRLADRATLAERGTARSPNLFEMIRGVRRGETTLLQTLEGRSHLFRMVTESAPFLQPDDPGFETRQAYALDLFWALVERLQQRAESAGTEVVLALMSGKSHVESPASLSGRFQEFFRAALAHGASSRSLPVVDIAGTLRTRFEQTGGRWFHPNEGHLNPDGHREVAAIVAKRLGAALP